jgi:preprotein translocase subunit YajC
VHTILLNLAQAAAPAAGANGGGGGAFGACGGGGGASSLIFMLLMFAVFWFILIRPQQKRAKEHQAFLSALKKGDQVITRGGVIGRVTGVADNLVTLEVQEKVRIRVLKSYIESRHVEGSSAAASDKSKDAKDVKEARDKEKDKDAEAASELKS